MGYLELLRQGQGVRSIAEDGTWGTEELPKRRNSWRCPKTPDSYKSFDLKGTENLRKGMINLINCGEKNNKIKWKKSSLDLAMNK